MICKGCISFSTKTTNPPAQFLLYGCRLKKITFGIESDLVNKTPKKCKERESIK